MKNDFTGYVLAGGKSSRMGRDKAFLRIGEKSFLENAVGILTPVCERVKIVLNGAQTEFVSKTPAEVPCIFDIYENRGAVGGIHAALRDCQTDFAVILAVDLPFVTVEAIENLIETALSSDDFSIVVPRQNDDRIQPLCAVYRKKDCLNIFAESAETNKFLSVSKLIEKLKTKIVPPETLTANRDIFFNINTLGDFEKLEKL